MELVYLLQYYFVLGNIMFQMEIQDKNGILTQLIHSVIHLFNHHHIEHLLYMGNVPQTFSIQKLQLVPKETLQILFSYR